MPKLYKIWNLRADSAWIKTVTVQALQAGRSSPGAFIRDLVWLLSQNPKLHNQIMQEIQAVHYGK